MDWIKKAFDVEISKGIERLTNKIINEELEDVTHYFKKMIDNWYEPFDFIKDLDNKMLYFLDTELRYKELGGTSISKTSFESTEDEFLTVSEELESILSEVRHKFNLRRK